MPVLTYIGHSAFALDGDGKQVLIDPFLTGNPSAKHKADDFNPQTILLSHGHGDHVGDTEEIGKRTGAKIVSTAELGDLFQMKGLNAYPGNHGGTISFDGGTVKLTQAWHTSSYDAEAGNWKAPGVPAGLLVRFGGLSFYFAGDTALFSDMKLIGEEGVDVAILPIGDRYTMGASDAVRAVKFVEPKYVIPCHYNTFPGIEADASAFKARVEAETPAKVLVLSPGESHDFSGS
jgi:L-ascorbate metabolism protein UlaG (beta-lactamase superfamily)